MARYPIPAADLDFEQTIKKSRFVCHLGHAPNAAAAQQFIARIAADYPDARHVCYAFVAGQPGNTTAVGCSDAGEPSGSAGKPMLNVLMHSGIGEIVAVVVRYFGGIKLGTGGLVRAYGGTLSEAMQRLQTRELLALQWLTLGLPYSLESSARRLIEDAGGHIEAADYSAGLTLRCALPEAQIDALLDQLRDQSSGRLEVGRR